MIALSALDEESGFRKIVLGGDGLEDAVCQPVFERADRRRVAGEQFRSKRVNLIEWDAHSTLVPQWRSECSAMPANPQEDPGLRPGFYEGVTFPQREAPVVRRKPKEVDVRLTICAVLLTALAVCAQERAVGEGVNLYSIQKEAALGAQMAQEVRQSTTPIDSAAVRGYVEKIGPPARRAVPRCPPSSVLSA